MLQKLILLFITISFINKINAQVVINTTSSPTSSSTTTKKSGTKKKKLTSNTSKKKKGTVNENLKIVYVVQVMSSSDRLLVYDNKAKLYQMYPTQRVYVASEPPFYKLRLGFFTTKEKALKYRNQIGAQFGMEAYVVKDKVKINTIKIIKPRPVANPILETTTTTTKPKKNKTSSN